MWRSFFLAVGIGLMAMGVEALVFERVVLNESAKLPSFLNGVFEKDLLDSFTQADYSPGQGTSAFQNPSFQTANAANFQRVPYSTESRFGPSRFSGPTSGNYGGGRVDLSRSGLNSNNGPGPIGNALPVSFSNGANPISVRGGIENPTRTRRTKTILTRDWMPWSLLAAGAIIFLYTSSHDRYRNE